MVGVVFICCLLVLLAFQNRKVNRLAESMFIYMADPYLFRQYDVKDSAENSC